MWRPFHKEPDFAVGVFLFLSFLNYMLLELQQIIVKPGQQTLLKNVNWQQFEKILDELGESRAARLSYSNGWLEIMVPLP